ncbi:hypothetical protein HZC09_05725 [Candidatus Micrarchaeota archaeon]|nr:hypothetical protein [Candidatus Micrarchaeota archaeon]
MEMNKKIGLVISVVLVFGSLIVLQLYSPRQPSEPYTNGLEATPAPAIATTKPSPTPTPTPVPKAVTKDGDYFLLSTNKVLEITKDKQILREFPFKANSAQRLENGMTLLSYGSKVFEVDADGREVWSYSDASMNATYASMLSDGTLLVSDANRRLLKVKDGQIVWLQELGEGSVPSSVIQIQGGGDVLFADKGLNTVTWMAQDGFVYSEYGNKGQKGETYGYLDTPVFAAQMPNGNFIIADYGNRRSIEINSNKQLVWNYNFNNATSVWPVGNTRLIASHKGAMLVYQNRTYDWQYEGDVYRAFPVTR